MSTRQMPSLFALDDVGSTSWKHMLHHVGQLVANGDTIEIVEPTMTVRLRAAAVALMGPE